MLLSSASCQFLPVHRLRFESEGSRPRLRGAPGVAVFAKLPLSAKEYWFIHFKAFCNTGICRQKSGQRPFASQGTQLRSGARPAGRPRGQERAGMAAAACARAGGAKQARAAAASRHAPLMTACSRWRRRLSTTQIHNRRTASRRRRDIIAAASHARQHSVQRARAGGGASAQRRARRLSGGPRCASSTTRHGESHRAVAQQQQGGCSRRGMRSSRPRQACTSSTATPVHTAAPRRPLSFLGTATRRRRDPDARPLALPVSAPARRHAAFPRSAPAIWACCARNPPRTLAAAVRCDRQRHPHTRTCS
jgi:hypothetical protein